MLTMQDMMGGKDWTGVTTEEAAQAITEYVEGMRNVSLAELHRFFGETGKGDRILHVPNRPNTVLWAGCSQLFCDAFKLASCGATRRITIQPTGAMIYAMDGAVLRFPIAKHLHLDRDFKHERWIPVVLNPKDKSKPNDVLSEAA